MPFVGIGTSIGIQMNISFVTRSLAEFFMCLKPHQLPAKFDVEFINMLEDGAIYTDYEFGDGFVKPWWTGAGWAQRSGPLKVVDLGEALQFFFGRQQSLGNCPSRTLFAPGSVSQEMATTLLHSLEQTDATVDAFADSTEADLSMIARRTCGFFMLHEAAVALDTTDDTATRDPERQHQTDQSRPTPSAGSQWVHGRALTENEVLDILQTQRKGPHDGYLRTLRPGKMDGEYSPGPDSSTDPGSIIEHSVACEDAAPETANPIPSYFNHAKYRAQNWSVPAAEDSMSAALEFRKQEKIQRKKLKTQRAKERRTIQADIAEARMQNEDAEPSLRTSNVSPTAIDVPSAADLVEQFLA